MSDQANVPAAPPAEQAQEGYLQSAYRLVSDALSGASTVAQDTAADASAAAQDTASSATTAVQDAYDSAPAVLPGSTNASTEKNQAEEQGKEEAATTKSEAERREARIEETKAAGRELHLLPPLSSSSSPSNPAYMLTFLPRSIYRIARRQDAARDRHGDAHPHVCGARHDTIAGCPGARGSWS